MERPKVSGRGATHKRADEREIVLDLPMVTRHYVMTWDLDRCVGCQIGPLVCPKEDILHVEGENPTAGAHPLRQVGQKVAGARAQIDDGHARFQAHQLDHVGRQLPGVPVRSVENRGPALRVGEIVCHAVAPVVVGSLFVVMVRRVLRPGTGTGAARADRKGTGRDYQHDRAVEQGASVGQSPSSTDGPIAVHQTFTFP